MNTLLLLFLASLGACSGGTLSDPSGDNFVGTTPLDIVEISARILPTTVTIEVTFQPTPTLQDDLMWLGGFIEIDADGGASTGHTSFFADWPLEVSDPLPAHLVEYRIDFIGPVQQVDVWYSDPGSSELVTVGSFPYTVSGATVTMHLPLCGQGPTDGLCIGNTYSLAVLIADSMLGDATDRAPNGSVPLKAIDFDGDGDTDMDDVALLRACRSGPSVPCSAACADKDLDGDGDVDQDDFGILQRTFGGPCATE